MLAALLFAFVADAAAHFRLNVNIRVFHIIHEAQQLRLLARVPMAYLVADKRGAADAPVPYTVHRFEGDRRVHYLDAPALRASPHALAWILADELELSIGGEVVGARTGRVRAYPANEQPPFAQREEAEAALAGPVYDRAFEATNIGDTVVDVELVYPVRERPARYSFRSTLNPELPGQDETANLLIDHASNPPLVFRVRGLLAEPVVVSRSAFRAGWTFAAEGMRHILRGTDHVLFVVCLVLSATTLAALAARVTGFTIGHSATLVISFFGYTPTQTWWIPLVETGIALSIVYAAFVAMKETHHRMSSAVAAALGLLHGLGFAFVLKEILGLDSPHLWQSLLAFNVGIEIGQLLIAIALWPMLALIARKAPERVRTVRWTLALPCMFVAMLWTGERATQYFANI